MIVSRRFADFESLVRGELDVIGLPRMPEDDAVEAAMILELSEYCEPKAVRIHLSDRGKVIGGPRHSYYRTRLQTLGLSGRFDGPHDNKKAGQCACDNSARDHIGRVAGFGTARSGRLT